MRYCKSTSFQANHNIVINKQHNRHVVCDTAKVRVFKQITTEFVRKCTQRQLFAILQKYEFSSKSQHLRQNLAANSVVCDTAKVRVFKQITTRISQGTLITCCLRYCKSTSFQANHNARCFDGKKFGVVCDTAKVRVFKQITTLTPFASYSR